MIWHSVLQMIKALRMRENHKQRAKEDFANSKRIFNDNLLGSRTPSTDASIQKSIS